MRGNSFNVGLFFYFCRVSKASRERMASWLVLPRSIRVCVPLALHHPSARCSKWFCVIAYGGQKTPREIMDALKWVFVQGYLCPGQKRDQSLSPWLLWRDVLLLYPHCCPSEASWHCNSNSLRSRLDKMVLIIHKIHQL